MPAPWMMGPVTATSGQQITPWIYVGHLAAPKIALYCSSGGNAHMILEAAELVTAGVAESSEVIFPGADESCAAGGTVTVVLANNRYSYLRLSASSDSSSSVYGGIT